MWLVIGNFFANVFITIYARKLVYSAENTRRKRNEEMETTTSLGRNIGYWHNTIVPAEKEAENRQLNVIFQPKWTKQ